MKPVKLLDEPEAALSAWKVDIAKCDRGVLFRGEQQSLLGALCFHRGHALSVDPSVKQSSDRRFVFDDQHLAHAPLLPPRCASNCARPGEARPRTLALVQRTRFKKNAMKSVVIL